MDQFTVSKWASLLYQNHKFYYGNGKILVEKQGSTTTAVYTYGNALIRKDGEIPLFDGQGNERIVTNAGETQINGINFDGFGNTIGTFGSSTSSYMYGAQSGYRTEGDAGLSQVGARYYDPQVGRFVTRDTYLDQKPYLYCEHDPINSVDPSGHDSSTISLGFGFGEVSISIGAGGIHTAGGLGPTLPGLGGGWSPNNPNPKGSVGWQLDLPLCFAAGTVHEKPGGGLTWGDPFGGIGWGGGVRLTYQFN